jgi:hypothetical protein
VGQPYATILSASGGVPPYAWSLSSGSSLPGGLTLASDGIISGVPTSGGTFRFIVRARDSAGTPAEKLQEVALTVSGGTTGSGGTLTVTAADLPKGSVGVYYAFSPTVSGGASPYVWTSTTLPAGLALDSRTGFITGTPTAAGTFPVVLTVTDANGVQVNRNLSMVIDGAAVDERTFLLNQGAMNCYAPGTNYELVLTDSIRDVSDNALAELVVPFSTGGNIDDVPPQVAFTIPADGAVDVSPTANITVVFNEAMDTASIVPESFAVYRITGFGGVPTQDAVGGGTGPSTLPTATNLIAETDRRFTFGPVEYLSALPAVGITLVPGQHYRVVMSASPRDLAGNQICNTSGQCGTTASPVEGATPSYSFEFRVGVQ